MNSFRMFSVIWREALKCFSLLGKLRLYRISSFADEAYTVSWAASEHAVAALAERVPVVLPFEVPSEFTLAVLSSSQLRYEDENGNTFSVRTFTLKSFLYKFIVPTVLAVVVLRLSYILVALLFRA